MYVSSEDIDKGARWLKNISGELEGTSFGILCVTRENLQAPWLNFEAGALSKSIDNSRVAPFLFDLERSDVHGPILQFQSTIYEREDFRKLVQTINSALPDDGLERAMLDEVFDVWWPKLKARLDDIPSAVQSPAEDRSRGHKDEKTEIILREILDLTRQQSKLLSTQDRTLALIRSGGPIQLSTVAVLELIDAWTELVNAVAKLDMSQEDFKVIDQKIRVGRKLISLMRHPSEMFSDGHSRSEPYGSARNISPSEF